MDVWQAASDGDHTTGWIGRWLDHAGEDPLAAVNVGTTVPLAMRGAHRAAAVVPAEGMLRLPGDQSWRDAVTTMATPSGRAPLAELAAASTRDLFEVVDRVGPLLIENRGDADSYAAEQPVAAGQPSRRLAPQLDVVATLVEAELPARVYGVSIGGFDTHANQAATHTALLDELDMALAPFVERMAMRRVTVLVHSEFGRRVAVNGSGGTDHGAAGAVLLAGAVRPGHHGEAPPLDGLVDGDLATTTDFRAVYAGVLEGVLGIDAGDIIADAPRWRSHHDRTGRRVWVVEGPG